MINDTETYLELTSHLVCDMYEYEVSGILSILESGMTYSDIIDEARSGNH